MHFTRTESTNVPVDRISHHNQDWQCGSNCWVQEQTVPWRIVPRVMLERWFTQWGHVDLDMSLDRKSHQQRNRCKRSVELLLQTATSLLMWGRVITWKVATSSLDGTTSSLGLQSYQVGTPNGLNLHSKHPQKSSVFWLRTQEITTDLNRSVISQ